MNTLLKGLREADNYTLTENGAITYKSTLNALVDLFALGAAYRTRSDSDCIFLFKKAYEDDPTLAMKCLFYLRDRAEGQGERRFFTVVCKWLANTHTDHMRLNLEHVPYYGRYDDWYTFVGTPLEKDMFNLMKNQLMKDIKSYQSGEDQGVSLLAKWLKSENTSSDISRKYAGITRRAFGMNHKEYRKMLSKLRERIKVLERLMSAGRWDEIKFDAIPSRAGIIYRNAFAKHDVERMRLAKEHNTEVVSYENFMKDEKTTVNTGVLYPYEVVSKAYNLTRSIGYNSWWYDRPARGIDNIDPTERNAVNKYWSNLKDYFDGCTFNGLCMIDTSGSMWGEQASAPINVAISLGLYCAERAKGPFANHYISFSRRPQLIETNGIDFVDKVYRIYSTNICENTNIEAAFDMLLNTAINNHCIQEDLPHNIIVVSDMQFDYQTGMYGTEKATLMENIRSKWERYGYKMPNLVYWNVDARSDTIPMKLENGITFVSGFSASTFESIMKGKTGLDLVLDKLNSSRYERIK